ncbi:MAG: hypothetical protein GX359_08215 [Clostridiales bacterium]|nr:hypothetical protein [Clostridiales bacterium]
MKTIYPMEAFALAMVVFSLNMQEALITGILLLLITVVGIVLDQAFGRALPSWSRKVCSIILIVAVTYSLFQIVFIRILQGNLDNKAIFLHLAIGMLIARHVISNDEFDYNNLLYESAFAYAALIIIGALREFLSFGTIFAFEIADFNFFTSGFQNMIIGFILSAIAIAILNKSFGYEEVNTESLWVIIPAVFAYQPFSLDLPWESVGIVISIVSAIVLILSVRMYLVFSKISKEWRKLPIELLSTGMIYLILMAI